MTELSCRQARDLVECSAFIEKSELTCRAMGMATARPCAPANLLGVDDVGFTKLIVNDVKGSMQIDPHRVYAVGWINGGKMAARLACEATSVFAGAGYISRSYALAPSATCFKATINVCTTTWEFFKKYPRVD